MNMPETAEPQLKLKETAKAGPFTEYVLPLESPQNVAADISKAEARTQLIVTDFAELEDGTLIELVEDPADRHHTLLAAWKQGKIEYLDEVNDGDRVLKPFPRTNELLKPLRLPKGASSYRSGQSLIDALEDLMSRCVAIHPKYIQVLADFVLSTWFVDRLVVAPYLAVVGLPQSGKTTLLKLLSLICRRSLLVADVSPASLYKLCAQFSPTILIDEAGTIMHEGVVRHLLRSGTTRDAISVKGNQILHSYGAKVISWIEPPDDPALNSRCILIPMFETTKSGLAKPADPDVQELASTLQTQLLQFRFENYKKLRLGSIPGDEILRPRTRDILYALSAAHPQDNKRTQALLEFFKSGEAIPQDSLSMEQNAVLRALFSMIHLQKSFVSIQTLHLTNTVNYLLQRAGEKLRLQPRKVGAVLKSLGFSNRKRTHLGWIVSLDQNDCEKIHQLAECYGIHDMSDRSLAVSRDECALCRAAAKRDSVIAPRNPNERSTTIDMRDVLGYQ
jgi:hypothetical protein